MQDYSARWNNMRLSTFKTLTFAAIVIISHQCLRFPFSWDIGKTSWNKESYYTFRTWAAESWVYRPGHWSLFLSIHDMAFISLLLHTFGSLFACVVFILFFKYLYSKLCSKCCSGKSSSMSNGVLSSNVNFGSQHQNAELSPPPSYDDLSLCSDIFVINIDGGEYDFSSRCHISFIDEQLPTYDEATMGVYPIWR